MWEVWSPLILRHWGDVKLGTPWADTKWWDGCLPSPLSSLLKHRLCHPWGDQLRTDNLRDRVESSQFVMLLNSKCRKASKCFVNCFVNCCRGRGAGQRVLGQLAQKAQQKAGSGGSTQCFQQNPSQPHLRHFLRAGREGAKPHSAHTNYTAVFFMDETYPENSRWEVIAKEKPVKFALELHFKFKRLLVILVFQPCN